MIRLTLRALGEVSQASSAQAALAQLAQSVPDLLNLDVRLDDRIGGLQLCRQRKDAPPTAGMKIMLLSGCGQQSDVTAGLRRDHRAPDARWRVHPTPDCN